jgi:hypothetical protein
MSGRPLDSRPLMPSENALRVGPDAAPKSSSDRTKGPIAPVMSRTNPVPNFRLVCRSSWKPESFSRRPTPSAASPNTPPISTSDPDRIFTTGWASFTARVNPGSIAFWTSLPTPANSPFIPTRALVKSREAGDIFSRSSAYFF